MTRTAPLMTLLAVGVLGGALFVANTVGAQEPPAAAAAAGNTAATAEAAPPAAAPPPPAEGGGAAEPAPAEPADPPATGRELDLSGVEVAGAGEGAEDAPPAEDEPDAPPAREEPDRPESTFAGESNDGTLTVAIAVNGNDAAAVVSRGGTEFALSGTATAKGLALKDRTGQVKLDGDNPGDGFTGSVTLEGERVRYSADPTSVADARADGRADVADAAERVGL